MKEHATVRLASSRIVRGIVEQRHPNGDVTVSWAGMKVIGSPLTPGQIAEVESVSENRSVTPSPESPGRPEAQTGG